MSPSRRLLLDRLEGCVCGGFIRAIGPDRLALDLTLANEPQREHRAGEAQKRAKREHVVQPGEETLARRVRRDLLGLRWKCRQRLVEAAR
jgi:hypothetical protein